MTALQRLSALTQRLQCGRTKIYELIKTEGFPKPIKIGGSSLWLESEVDKWLEAKIEEQRP